MPNAARRPERVREPQTGRSPFRIESSRLRRDAPCSYCICMSSYRCSYTRTYTYIYQWVFLCHVGGLAVHSVPAEETFPRSIWLLFAPNIAEYRECEAAGRDGASWRCARRDRPSEPCVRPTGWGGSKSKGGPLPRWRFLTRAPVIGDDRTYRRALTGASFPNSVSAPFGAWRWRATVVPNRESSMLDSDVVGHEPVRSPRGHVSQGGD